MARGFLAGAVVGLVVSAGVAGTVSVVMGPPVARPTPKLPAAVPVTEAPVTDDAVTDEAVTEAPETSVPEAPAAAAPEATVEPAEATPPAAADEAATRPSDESPVTAADPAPLAGTQAAETETPDATTAPPVAASDDAPDAAPAPAEDSAAETVTPTEDSAPSAEAAPAPEAPESEAEPEIATEPAAPPASAPASPRVIVMTPAGEAPDAEARPAIGTPAGSIISREGAVPTGRGTAPEETATAPEEATPLDLYAAEVDVPAGEPRMSIVLIDDGSGPLGPDTVEAFPFPVSFAIPPSHPDAAETARAYRERGFEVLAMTGVPAGATSADVEVTLEAALREVPEAVGVLEDPSSGLQGSRAVSEQSAAWLHASGHGLVLLPKGLNTGQAMALREGVPTATVFRDFDGEGQDPRVMRRFLDQAAFKARQEGDVIMLGRLRADTVSALLLWGLQDRAASVALVPVSVALKDSLAQD